LAEAKPHLDAQYLRVLGSERVTQLMDVAGKSLNGESFFDDRQEMNKRFGTAFSPNGPNAFVLYHSDIDVNKAEQTEIKTAPGFYISEIGTRNSSYKNIVQSYVHEWNHFVWYALQRVPMYIAYNMASDVLESEGGMLGVRDTREWLKRIAYNALNGGGSPEERADRVCAAACMFTFYEHYEKSNQVLDRMVLNAIGLDVDIVWRNTPRLYLGCVVNGKGIMFPSGDGDPYLGLTDMQVIDGMMNWENYTTRGSQTPYITKFMEMLRHAKVSRCSLSEIDGISPKLRG
jgi:hypothetical protein